MMTPSAPIDPSTTLGTISSIDANNNPEGNTAPVQSGPYTRAQCKSTFFLIDISKKKMTFYFSSKYN